MKTPDLALPDATLEERVAAFRSDPQLMEAATKFVNEVIEKAKEEALRRLKEKALNMKTLAGATLEERMAAFRSDPLLMEVATKFVNELKEEALRRLEENGLDIDPTSGFECCCRKSSSDHLPTNHCCHTFFPEQDS